MIQNRPFFEAVRARVQMEVGEGGGGAGKGRGWVGGWEAHGVDLFTG